MQEVAIRTMKTVKRIKMIIMGIVEKLGLIS